MPANGASDSATPMRPMLIREGAAPVTFWTKLKLVVTALSLGAALATSGFMVNEFTSSKPEQTQKDRRVLLIKPAEERPSKDASSILEIPDKPGSSAKSDELPWFQDRSAESGIHFTYRHGEEAGHYSLLETLGGGVALIDYDQDGLLDIFITGGGYFAGLDNKEIKGHPCRLYKNLGNFKFKNVTTEVGLNIPWFYTHGCAVADYDNDGWPDLLVTGWGRIALLHNEPDGKGGRRFVDVTQKAGLKDTAWSTSAAWADLDGDSFPDLYVCQYVDWALANNPVAAFGGKRDYAPPKKFKALLHILHKNNGDGTFTDVSQQAGLYSGNAPQNSKGLGVIIADFNGDGRPDIFVANDEMAKLLYLNKGNMKFDEIAEQAGLAYDDNGQPNGSKGVDAADYDGSGRLSLFVTNYEHEANGLYRNLGGGQFVFSSRPAGIPSIGLKYVGFDTGFIDFDRDGAEDIFITNGHILRHPNEPDWRKQPAVLLRNLRKPGDKLFDVRFENVSAKAGPFFQTRRQGRGAAFGDLDNDGRTDIVISHLNEPVVLLRNTLDNGNHWLGIELVGKPYRDAVGAKLTLEVGNQKLTRFIKGGGSYLSSSDRRVIFGLGKSKKSAGLPCVGLPARSRAGTISKSTAITGSARND
jgi:hypothetical protein